MFVITIAGGSGSGKSLLATTLNSTINNSQTFLLKNKITSNIILTDSYYKAQDNISIKERALVNYDHPDSIESELLNNHIELLKNNQIVNVPIYNFSTHTRENGYTTVSPTDVLIIEGILSLYFPKIREASSLKIFVDTDSDIRFNRRLERDIRQRGRTKESVYNQWQSTVYPMHKKYCEPTKILADIVISGEQSINVSCAQVMERVMAHLKLEF